MTVDKSAIKSMFSRFCSELFSVALAVLFALWVNNWWAERQIAIDAKASIVAIKTELKDNKALLIKALTHHKNQLSIVDTFLRQHAEPTDEAYQALMLNLFKSGVYQPAEPSEISWQIAKDKGLIASFSEKQLHQFKSAYTAMDRYHETWRDISSNFYIVTLLAKSEAEKVSLVKQSLNELWWREQTAIKAIEKTLAVQ